MRQPRQPQNDDHRLPSANSQPPARQSRKQQRLQPPIRHRFPPMPIVPSHCFCGDFQQLTQPAATEEAAPPVQAATTRICRISRRPSPAIATEQLASELPQSITATPSTAACKIDVTTHVAASHASPPRPNQTSRSHHHKSLYLPIFAKTANFDQPVPIEPHVADAEEKP